MDYEKLINKYGSPLFIYDKKKIIEKYKIVKQSFSHTPFNIFYAIKANSNIQILKIYDSLGSKFHASSIGDVFLAKKSSIDTKKISFTCPNLTNEELKYLAHNSISIDLDSISQIRRYGNINPNSNVGLRINPGIKTGYNKDLTSSGENSHFGIPISNLKEAIEKSEKYNLNINGIHYHLGSSSFEINKFLLAFQKTLTIIDNYFPNIKYLNIGGGLGISFLNNEKDFDIETYGKTISNYLKDQKIELRIELGEFLIWSTGILLTKVNTIKRTKNKIFVGVDANSNLIPTYYLYKTPHPMKVISKNPTKKTELVDICGNLCHGGDYLAKNIELPKIQEGDIILIQNAGAYCFSKASNLSSRLLPAQIILLEDKIDVICFKENLENLLKNQKI